MSHADAAPGQVRRRRTFRASLRSAVLIACGCVVACGKEGPPLPPLVRIPAAPEELSAERRGGSVDVRLVVPSANTDGTRPADVERVDIYAVTGPAVPTDDQLVKQATRVGSVDVKAPRDPDATVDADEPVSDVDAPEGPGVDQGASASFTEQLTADAFKPVDLIRGVTRSGAMPLAGPPFSPPVRVYAGVGISTRGRRGPFSARTPIPLVIPPPAVSALKIEYDESAIRLAWEGLPVRRPVQEAASGEVLAARPVGYAFPTTAYHVYEVKEAIEPDKTSSEDRLTSPAVEESRYEDKRIEWMVERCYRIRAVHAYDKLALEGDASSDVCVTPIDTFPPKPPTNVQVVPSEGAISLIWQRGEERDLAGFVVLRGATSSATMTPVTPAAIQETAFTDKVAPGVRYVYAIQAVDKSGNRSAPSARSEETEAR